jgi:hypothetical protein
LSPVLRRSDYNKPAATQARRNLFKQHTVYDRKTLRAKMRCNFFYTALPWLSLNESGDLVTNREICPGSALQPTSQSTAITENQAAEELQAVNRRREQSERP